MGRGGVFDQPPRGTEWARPDTSPDVLTPPDRTAFPLRPAPIRVVGAGLRGTDRRVRCSPAPPLKEQAEAAETQKRHSGRLRDDG